MIVYTSITKSYLPKARVLARSVKKFHPNWKFVLLFSDELPAGFDLAEEPFDELLMMHELNLPNWRSWAFGHALVELCTAVKGPAAEVLARRGDHGKIMYIDPDIKIFSSLASLDQLLDEHDILLTPHLLEAETIRAAIEDNEISALKHGVYNLGFFAAKTTGQGFEFIKWWAERLRHFCRDDIPGGLFTDQRWCDLAPAFFNRLHIVRDHGCNVATWNIAHRPLSKTAQGVYEVRGTPLRFYHFTSYDNGNGKAMLAKYASDQGVAQELWDTYGRELAAEGQGPHLDKNWAYAHFENGENIPSGLRRLFKNRKDLQMAFPNPYSVQEPSLANWWTQEISNGRLPGHETVSRPGAVGRVVRLLAHPQEAKRLITKSIDVLRLEGISGFARRFKNHIS